MVKNLKIVLGKGKGSTKSKTDVLFKKRSIFWNLLYWKDLIVHHAIDVMHVDKNVCEVLIGTLLDIPSKTKDTVKACKATFSMFLCHRLLDFKKNYSRKNINEKLVEVAISNGNNYFMYSIRQLF
jgi:hypothetical protein